MDPVRIATQGGSAPPDWAGLPRELLHHIYGLLGAAYRLCAYDTKESVLRQSVTGQAVCRHWRRALRDLPLAVRIDEESRDGLLQWLVTRRPAVARLELHPHRRLTKALAVALLHSLPPQALQELEYNEYSRPAMSLPALLPYPGMLHSLQSLDVRGFVWSKRWLRQLDGLPRLQRLTLHSCHWAEGSAAEAQQLPMVLPPLRHVTYLDLAPGTDTVLRLAPADLPSLRELHVDSYWGRTEVVASRSSSTAAAAGQGAGGSSGSALTYLYFWGKSDTPSSVDFAALPALHSAQLWCEGMEGVETLRAATALSSLRLESEEEQELSPWAAAVLRAAPTTLRCLRLSGTWGKEEAAAVGDMGHLQLLELDGFGGSPPPPPGAAVWRSLRAFYYTLYGKSAGLPVGLRYATQLVWLAVNCHNLSRGQVAMLAALPALRSLYLDLGADQAHTLERLRQALPERVKELQGTWVFESFETFGEGFFDRVEALAGWVPGTVLSLGASSFCRCGPAFC